jgi:hypothetical protein
VVLVVVDETSVIVSLTFVAVSVDVVVVVDVLVLVLVDVVCVAVADVDELVVVTVDVDELVVVTVNVDVLVECGSEMQIWLYSSMSEVSHPLPLFVSLVDNNKDSSACKTPPPRCPTIFT